MAVEALFRRIVGDRFGRIAAFPCLEPPAARRRILFRVLDHYGEEFTASLVIDTVVQGKLPDVVDENRAVRVCGRAAVLEPVSADRVHVDEVDTSEKPRVVGLLRHKHGIRQVSTLEIHRHQGAIVSACEYACGDQYGYERCRYEQSPIQHIEMPHGVSRRCASTMTE